MRAISPHPDRESDSDAAIQLGSHHNSDGLPQSDRRVRRLLDALFGLYRRHRSRRWHPQFFVHREHNFLIHGLQLSARSGD